MDRVTDKELAISDVARFWSREPGTIFSQAEIVDTLIRAIWRGDLTIVPPAGHSPRSGDYRRSLLAAVVGVHSHPGLLFVLPEDDVEPVETELPDGSVLFDLRERISWAAHGDEPSDAMAQAAFVALASLDLDAYDEAVVGPILHGLSIDRDALRIYCEGGGISLPRFWFPKESQTRSTSSAEQQCKKWLVKQAGRSDKPGNKSDLKRDAMAQFAGLSGAAFDRAWEKAAPPAWKKSGAPAKAARRKR